MKTSTGSFIQWAAYCDIHGAAGVVLVNASCIWIAVIAVIIIIPSIIICPSFAIQSLFPVRYSDINKVTYSVTVRFVATYIDAFALALEQSSAVSVIQAPHHIVIDHDVRVLSLPFI